MTQSEWSATKLGECAVFFDGDDCAGGLIRDAAIAEIERLRLTDEERKVVEGAIKWYDNCRAADTLRSLLERLA